MRARPRRPCPAGRGSLADGDPPAGVSEQEAAVPLTGQRARWPRVTPG